VFKKFTLGCLLVAGLTACPIITEPPPIVSPTANDDIVEISISQTSKIIEPAANDKKGDADLDPSSIDLNTSLDGQQKSAKDASGLGLGSFTLTGSGIVTFTATGGGKVGKATAKYSIKDANGNTSDAALISVTISSTIPTGNIKVLFIGNSRTVYNGCGTPNPGVSYNIPSIVQNMSVNEPRKLEATIINECGRTLNEHLGTLNVPGDARAPIATKGWEYVVLQVATNETDAGIQSATTMLQQYKSIILAANPNAKIILSENWSLQCTATLTTSCGTSDQSRLTAFFQQAADNLSTAKIAPIGSAWRQQPGFLETQLFTNDGETVIKHATPLGAYVAASTYFSLIYGKQAPAGIGAPNSISTNDANTARTNAYAAFTSMKAIYK
jgi:hypothetical protein